jgi:hypothetical protein
MKAKIFPIAFAVSLILSFARPAIFKASAADYCIPGAIYLPYIFGIGGWNQPAVAHTSNGDTIEIIGYLGWIDPTGNNIGIEGNFTYRNSAGSIIYQGTWVSTGIIQKFKYYGCDEGLELWPGGRGAFRIIMTATDGSTFNGTLDVESPNGEPPAGAIDGIRLSVKAWGLYFNQPVSVHNNVIFSIF